MDDIGKVRRPGSTFQKADDILLFGSKNSMWAQNVKIVNIVVAQNQNVNMVKIGEKEGKILSFSFEEKL